MNAHVVSACLPACLVDHRAQNTEYNLQDRKLKASSCITVGVTGKDCVLAAAAAQHQRQHCKYDITK